MLDTSAFLAGFDPFLHPLEQVSCPLVQGELKSKSTALFRVKTAIDTGKLKIRSPSSLAVRKIQGLSEKAGDLLHLSKTDLELLALAQELKDSGYKPLIVSDDYSIQNVATLAGIQFSPLSTFGITRLLEWVRYCPGCHKRYPSNYADGECSICGTALRRKPSKKNIQK